MVVHIETLKIALALYPIQQSQLKCYGIAKGAFTQTTDGLFNGVPNTMVIGLVGRETYARQL